MNTTKTRTIHTRLYGAQAYTVIDSVHGQLSDGKWENTPGYDKYWTNFDVQTADDGEVIFVVNAESFTTWCSSAIANPFYKMSEADFKTWIAKKIKAVVNDERKDRCKFGFGEWDRKNIDHTSLYLGHCDEQYGSVVTVADIYCTYDALLGRSISAAKYDSSTIQRVFGTKRSDEEIDIHEKYARRRADLQRAKNEAVAKLEKELQDNINKLDQEEKAELERTTVA